jgi:hypothetical protein
MVAARVRPPFASGGGRNRTHRTGITRPTRFEDEGAHQAPVHLQFLVIRLESPGHLTPPEEVRMKKLMLLVIVIALGALVAKKKMAA